MSVNAPAGTELPLSHELLFRQVSPSFLKVGGFFSSQIFNPTSKDDGLLSVDRSTLAASAEASLVSFNQDGGRSCGVLGVTVAEVGAQGLRCHEDPLPHNAAHAVANFRGLTRGQRESKAKSLLACTEHRDGYLYQLPPAPPAEG